MDKAYTLSTPNGSSITTLLGLKRITKNCLVLYFSTIGALIYLTNNTRPNIVFFMNLQEDKVLLLPEDIEMKLNIFFITNEELWMLAYFIQIMRIMN
jgi:hypothetical protein